VLGEVSGDVKLVLKAARITVEAEIVPDHPRQTPSPLFGQLM
jgi:hypothetical protein